MPIYEYLCTQCGHELEALQKISDEPLKQCPSCGADALNKQVSAAGFRLKGSGWYETDFKSGKKKNVAGSETSASESGKSEGAGASEKKSEPSAASNKSDTASNKPSAAPSKPSAAPSKPSAAPSKSSAESSKPSAAPSK